MPTAKKISELPLLSSVQPNDILPIVDEALTQTSHCKASQIAAIGGGPPGSNTVETVHLKDGIVTAAKTYFTGPDKLFSRTAAGAGQGAEISCTPYARGLLATADASGALTYLGGLQTMNDPSFTGQVKLANGTSVAPSLTNIGNLDTGLFFPIQNAIGLSTDGYESLRVAEDGQQYSNIPGSDALRPLFPQYSVRAWVTFDGNANTAYTIANQHTISQRYRGQWGSLADTAATKSRIQSLESSTTGWTVSFPTSAPNYNVGTEGRTNYTTPGDNYHYLWDGSAWLPTAATNYLWIGRITLTPPATGQTIIGSGNIASVKNSSTGVYDIVFTKAMPDTNYAIMGTCESSSAANTGVVRVVKSSIATTGFRVTTVNVSGSVYNAEWVSVAVVR